MAHKVLENGNVVVDWTTGDPEGDRIHILSAYRDFLIEIKSALKEKTDSDALRSIIKSFDTWHVDTDNQIDDIPRIWIKRPE